MRQNWIQFGNDNVGKGSGVCAGNGSRVSVWKGYGVVANLIKTLRLILMWQKVDFIVGFCEQLQLYKFLPDSACLDLQVNWLRKDEVEIETYHLNSNYKKPI